MNDICNKVCLDIQAQICSCALLQLAYDNHLGRVSEFIPSTEKILVPGGSCFLADRSRPPVYVSPHKEAVHPEYTEETSLSQMQRWLDTLIQDWRDIRRGISYVQRGGIGRDIAHSESRFMRDVNLKTSGTRH